MMRHPILKLITALLLAASLFSPASYAATVWASVSKNKVAKNEVFQLRVVTDQKVSADAIDFSALEKDFYVGRPGFGSSVNIINGDRTVRSEWNVSLAAQKLGKMIIPAFDINGDKSQPIALQVTMDEQDPNIADLVEMRASLNSSDLYPNESATLKTRLIIKTDPRRLQNPQVEPPAVNGLTLTQIGEPNQYQSVLNGVQVTVVDQNYRVTAEKAGEYQLKGPSFKGAVIYGSSVTGTTKMINVDTAPKQFDISVRPKPAGYKGVWLPTTQLTLQQTWTDSSGNPVAADVTYPTKIGDALTREITLDITGLSSERFPDIKVNYPDTIRVYSEKPQFSEPKNGVTRMTLKQVLIPQSTGDIPLNSISINWWNSKAKQQQTSKIQGLTLNVSPGEALNAAPANFSAPVAATPAISPEVQTVTVKDRGIWPYLTGLFAALWLITVIIAIKMRRTPRAVKPEVATASGSIVVQVKQALAQGDTIRAQYCVHQWMTELPLSQEEQRDIQHELDAMNASSFSSSPSRWQPSALLKQLAKLDKRQRSASSSPDQLTHL